MEERERALEGALDQGEVPWAEASPAEAFPSVDAFQAGETIPEAALPRGKAEALRLAGPSRRGRSGEGA